MNSFAIVGCGKMGQALARCIIPVISAKCLCCDVSDNALSEIHQQFGDRVVCTKDLQRVADTCDVVLLAVKPVHAPKVLSVLATGMSKTILSIVAGIASDKLKSMASRQNVVRMMPNTPALVGAGSVVVFDDKLPDTTKSLIQTLFTPAGVVHFVQNEDMMDAVTGLSGSCPALFAIMAEALADAAVAQGLTRDLASALARETMYGTAKLLEKQHPDILKENVMSPGGTTAAGIIAAENAAFRAASQAFVIAATQKSRNMH
jgi:pyrroline-5-carboxylate reductase